MAFKSMYAFQLVVAKIMIDALSKNPGIVFPHQRNRLDLGWQPYSNCQPYPETQTAPENTFSAIRSAPLFRALITSEVIKGACCISGKFQNGTYDSVDYLGLNSHSSDRISVILPRYSALGQWK